MASSFRSLSLSNPRSTEYDAGFLSQQDTAKEDKALQYRQLISRAITQRLHSTSLEDLTRLERDIIMGSAVEAWELQERVIARGKAQATIRKLGIPWESFVHDVNNASAEVHILTPTRYEAPSSMPYTNQDAAEANERLAYTHVDGHVADTDVTWKKTHEAVFEALSIFSRARLKY